MVAAAILCQEENQGWFNQVLMGAGRRSGSCVGSTWWDGVARDVEDLVDLVLVLENGERLQDPTLQLRSNHPCPEIVCSCHAAGAVVVETV